MAGSHLDDLTALVVVAEVSEVNKSPDQRVLWGTGSHRQRAAPSP